MEDAYRVHPTRFAGSIESITVMNVFKGKYTTNVMFSNPKSLGCNVGVSLAEWSCFIKEVDFCSSQAPIHYHGP